MVKKVANDEPIVLSPKAKALQSVVLTSAQAADGDIGNVSRTRMQKFVAAIDELASNPDKDAARKDIDAALNVDTLPEEMRVSQKRDAKTGKRPSPTWAMVALSQARTLFKAYLVDSKQWHDKVAPLGWNAAIDAARKMTDAERERKQAKALRVAAIERAQERLGLDASLAEINKESRAAMAEIEAEREREREAATTDVNKLAKSFADRLLKASTARRALTTDEVRDVAKAIVNYCNLTDEMAKAHAEGEEQKRQRKAEAAATGDAIKAAHPEMAANNGDAGQQPKRIGRRERKQQRAA